MTGGILAGPTTSFAFRHSFLTKRGLEMRRPPRNGCSFLQPMLVIETTTEALELAEELLRAGALPRKAADDALHIAIAATKAIPYLLTWNCRHLANATMRPVIEAVWLPKDYKAPIICTPEELLESMP